jgi:hypothetical protein
MNLEGRFLQQFMVLFLQQFIVDMNLEGRFLQQFMYDVNKFDLIFIKALLTSYMPEKLEQPWLDKELYCLLHSLGDLMICDDVTWMR